jgi:hypothetical protein
MKRTPKHQSPLTLPIKIGLVDGSNAHLLTDAKGEVFGNLFGIAPGVSAAEARRVALYTKGVATADFVINAVNSHDTLVLALRKIVATSVHKRIIKLATDALAVAGEE